MSKKTFTIIIIIVIVALAGGGYWFYLNSSGGTATQNPSEGNSGPRNGNIFSPLSGNTVTQTGTAKTSSSSGTIGSTTNTQNTNPTQQALVPTLRELSSTPVGGMSASTTGTSTIVRWIDRGTGYIYQADMGSLAITELSNTTVPMVYQSFWNKNASAFILRSLTDDSDAITNFYTVLSPVATHTDIPNATSTASTSLSMTTPFNLEGQALPSDIVEIAVSPSKTNLFTLDTAGNGYISGFDGSKRTQLFSSPLTELNVEWPADTIIALTTKGLSSTPGFLYFVNAKTGIFTKVLAGINGLDTLTSHDATKVLYSTSDSNSSVNNNGLATAVYNIKTNSSQGLAFNTLPEKCVWSMTNKDDLICAVPSKVLPAAYPEAWYQGTVSFSDSLWEVNVATGEVHELADLLNISGKIIDAENLTLDPKENYLYFINKKDLTLWSVSLNGQ